MMPCSHPEFQLNGEFTTIQDVGQLMLDLTVWCVRCNEKFCFVGLPMGVSFDHPMMSPDGTELRAPLIPMSRSSNPVAERGTLRGFHIKQDV